MRPEPKLFIRFKNKAFLLIAFIALPGKLIAQDSRVVFPEVNMTIQEAFDEIERQTDYLISVNNTNFDITRKIKFSRNNLSVKNALEQILARSGRRFNVYGHHIVVYTANEPIRVVVDAPVSIMDVESLPSEQEIELLRPPVDVDSLELALRKRKVEFPAEIPPEPLLNATAYYNQRDRDLYSTVRPVYVASLPKVALRTNILYDFAALTPNIGIEIALSPRSTILATGSYNRWGLNNESRHKTLCHWLTNVEYRYWFCERFNGHFLGMHGYYGEYHIKGVTIPILMSKGSDNYRYKGKVYGAGISYGYQMILSSNFNMEFNLGVGMGSTTYDKYDCDRCSDKIEKNLSKTFVAPTKLGISFVYVIKSKK